MLRSAFPPNQNKIQIDSLKNQTKKDFEKQNKTKNSICIRNIEFKSCVLLFSEQNGSKSMVS